MRTALCDVLGIEHPIVPSGMGGIVEPDLVATVDHARTLAASGVDVIVAQGGEAGGHRSIRARPASAEAASIGALALLPQIVDAVPVPVRSPTRSAGSTRRRARPYCRRCSSGPSSRTSTPPRPPSSRASTTRCGLGTAGGSSVTCRAPRKS